MTTIWILGDQLAVDHRALAAVSRQDACVLMIESKARGVTERYHQHKLVLVYSAMRHFAERLRMDGWRVDYHRLEAGHTFETGLRLHLAVERSSDVVLAEPNSFAETDAVAALCERLGVRLRSVPTTQFLLSRDDFREWAAGRTRLLMEQHYRRMRRRFGWLMHADGEPVGGAWNFDAENRATHAAWRRAGAPRAARQPRVAPDAITREVIDLVQREFPDHPGRGTDFWLPTDREGALEWLDLFVHERLPRFGTFEDMMSEGEPFLFHSVLSPLVNLGLLSPRECVDAAVAAYGRGEAPLNAVEGYVRQVVGWREFVNGVYWLRGPEYRDENVLEATRPLPGWCYTAETPMNCLHHVLGQTLALGWNHHIQRLMVLGNFFLVAGVRPQEALRWYLEMYVDAFDWVMAPNVLGMSLYADGGYMATKPYAATSAYIRRMSNYCDGCRFDPNTKSGERACPFNYLYWSFVDRHAHRFAQNPRMRAVVSAWTQRPAAEQAAVRESAASFLAAQVPDR